MGDVREFLQFYIDGQWVDPSTPKTLDVIDPSNEEITGRISLGQKADVDKAVAAARGAFESFSQTSQQERIALLKKVVEVYEAHLPELAACVSREMGAPLWWATAAQAPAGLGHLKQALAVLEGYEFEEVRGTTCIIKEPVGVCGLITPWNWPLNQISCKVGPALAAGCTMVLKPSEIAPLSAGVFTNILHEAGVPAGVFNMVNGDGPTVGAAISSHPEIDMVSFTGSTRAGKEVAKAGADTIKRIAQELGGKSANIILDDADLDAAVRRGVSGCFSNSGQSCNAPTRMFVPADRHEEALAIAKEVAEGTGVGGDEGQIGPVVSDVQFEKIQRLIRAGIEEGASLVAGGPGRPEGRDKGYFVQPTVFGGVSNDMTIAREEIFGPVLSILPYETEDDAIRQANDSPYGLYGYVQSGDQDRARRVAKCLRTGAVAINGAGPDNSAPFGGYKQSGNGREWGDHGFEEYLEMKSVPGWKA